MAGKSPEERVDQGLLVEIFTGAVDHQMVARPEGISDRAIALNGAGRGNRVLPVAPRRDHAACARGEPGLSSRLPRPIGPVG